MDHKFTYEGVRSLHIEITDKCNAACPMCVRNINGGPDNPYLPRKEIKLDLFTQRFSPAFLKQLKKVYFCGNYGDPALGTDLIPIIRYIRTHSNASIGMNTNGGVGSPRFWQELASLINREGDYCTFSIDGLEDTNHLYRKHVRWSHVMQSAKAFIGAGGKATWDYIIFKHNEHQVEEARQLANSMGFEHFAKKESGRFLFFTNELRLEAFPVLNKNMEVEYFLEPPSNGSTETIAGVTKKEALDGAIGNKWQLNLNPQNPRKTGLEARFFKDDNQENAYVTKATIKCRVLIESSIFISSEGLVFPCCWTAYPINTYWDNNDSLQLRQLIDKCGGRETIDLGHRSLEEIVHGDFFRAIAASWSSPCARDGKLVACANQCGEQLERLSKENVIY